jgi:hypothetical protein
VVKFFFTKGSLQFSKITNKSLGNSPFSSSSGAALFLLCSPPLCRPSSPPPAAKIHASSCAAPPSSPPPPPWPYLHPTHGTRSSAVCRAAALPLPPLAPRHLPPVRSPVRRCCRPLLTGAPLSLCLVAHPDRLCLARPPRAYIPAPALDPEAACALPGSPLSPGASPSSVRPPLPSRPGETPSPASKFRESGPPRRPSSGARFLSSNLAVSTRLEPRDQEPPQPRAPELHLPQYRGSSFRFSPPVEPTPSASSALFAGNGSRATIKTSSGGFLQSLDP